MMFRRRCVCFVAGLVLVGPLQRHVTFAVTPENSAVVAPGGPTLKVALEKGLKARRPSEFAFIEHVVARVKSGTLPQTLVERTFLWARDNKQPYPMPYFEEALRRQAKKLNVVL